MGMQPVFNAARPRPARDSAPWSAFTPQALLAEAAIGGGGNMGAVGAAVATLFGGVVTVVLVACAIAFYFLPTFIARRRRHRSPEAVFVLNLLLGWTLLGWVGALGWALA